MTKKSRIIKELNDLYSIGAKLAQAFIDRNEATNFYYEYQSWYTKAVKVISLLAPDRYSEFRSYYEIDPKRKSLGYGTYVIQDYMKGVAPSRMSLPNFDTRTEVYKCFINQLAIFHSLTARVDSILCNIQDELYSELQDEEILIARNLIKISPRAAGALMGVVIEGYLQKIAVKHQIKITKKNPTISDLNEPLKNEGIIDTPTWRKITYLADLRNLCSHKKDIEPTKGQVEELIDGADWLIKNIF